jgi:hypothetical protein
MMTPISNKKNAKIAAVPAMEAKLIASKIAEIVKSTRNPRMNGKLQFWILRLFRLEAIFLKKSVITLFVFIFAERKRVE